MAFGAAAQAPVFVNSGTARIEQRVTSLVALRDQGVVKQRFDYSCGSAALAAASVMVEGLRRAGRDLSRERFVQALESLNNYDPQGFAPAVSYGPDRRTGALGGYVVALDRSHGLIPATGWISLD